MRALFFFLCSILCADAPRVRYEQKILTILDQRKWPQEEAWIEVQNPEHLVDLIQTHVIVGDAPIRAAAALTLARLAGQRPCRCKIDLTVQLFKKSFPGEPCLIADMDRILEALKGQGDLYRNVVETAEAIYKETI